MNRDTVILGAIAGLTIVAATVSDIVTGSVPDVLAAAVTVTIGAVAGGAFATRKATDDGTERG